MASTAERGTTQPREQGRIDKVLHSPMSRRTFIKRAGAVLLSAEIAAACGVPTGATATAHPTTTGAESSPVTSFVPESIKPVDIPTLSSDTFNKVFGYYSDTTEVNIGGKQETVKSLASEASNIWNDGNLTSITAGRNAVEGLRLALSASELSGNTGTVDFSKIFKGLNIELPRFSISTLTNGKDTEEASNVLPSNLTLRKGMDMTVVGIDDTKGNAIVAFSDTLRKPDNSPTMYFASIPVEASSGQLSFSELLARNGATYDSKTHEILYTNGKTLPIYKLDTTLSQSLEQETGVYFLDSLGKTKDGSDKFTPNPVVLSPDSLTTKKLGVYDFNPKSPSLVNDIILKQPKITLPDSNGFPVLQATYNNNNNEWSWTLYSGLLKEFGATHNLFIGTTTDGSEDVSNSTYWWAAGDQFSSISVNGQMMPQVVENGNWSGVAQARNEADEHNDILFLGPAFYPRFEPASLANADANTISNYVNNTIDNVLTYVHKVSDGYQPTYITFVNEAVWDYQGNVGWYNNAQNENPFYKVWGQNWIAEIYTRFYKQASSMGLEVGKDLRLVYNESHIYTPGEKLNFVHNVLQNVKQEIFAKLGIPVNKVPLDVGMELHLSSTPDYNNYTPIPTTQELVDAIKAFSDIGTVHLTEFDVKNVSESQRVKTFADVIKAAIESGNCNSITLWDTFRFNGDPNSIFDYGPNGLFNDNYHPTSSFNSLISRIS